ncbi:MAG: hydroxyacid dehydrogenase [Limnochordia bacterium]|jgi:D-3-phosphoglycerate dehydrogenase
MVTAKPKVLVFGSNIHPVGITMLKEAAVLEFAKADDPKQIIMAKAKGARAFFVRTGKVSAELMDAAGPSLEIIARHGMGVDSVDIQAAAERGIMVTTTGPANSQAVAEYTFALLLGLIRNIPKADGIVRSGRWERGLLVGSELAEKTIGLIGLGQIGSRVARIARGFSMNILGYDPYVIEAEGVQLVDLPRLLAESDIVSLHVPHNENTHHLIDASAISHMKKGAILVNTCRGGVVDQEALKEALQRGRLAGAALDTFAVEPVPPDEDLVRLDNVIASPHVGAQTEEALYRMSKYAAEAIIDKLEGRTPRFVYQP